MSESEVILSSIETYSCRIGDVDPKILNQIRI